MQKFFHLFSSTLISFSLLVLGLFFVPSFVQAEDYGLDKTAQTAKLTQYGEDVPTIAGRIIGTALSMISVIFFILMVYGGFLWMTAHGDEGQVTKARETIIAAIIGIIVILASYAITDYVMNSVNPDSAAPTPTVRP